MPPEQPTVVVLGGVNGAGKSTSARALLAQQLAITTFVNSDEIARGLNAFAPHTVAFEAGRVMLNRLRELAEARSDIGFETTLAGRTYLPFLTELKGTGYAIEIHYFWLQSPELAVQRIRDRVQSGGHDIPTHCSSAVRAKPVEFRARLSQAGGCLVRVRQQYVPHRIDCGGGQHRPGGNWGRGLLGLV